MHTATHPEYTAYDYHTTSLVARDKVINRITYKGYVIVQKASGGFYVEDELQSFALCVVKDIIDCTILAMPVDMLLDRFRTKFYLSRVMVYANCLVYRTDAGFASDAAAKANSLIQELGLPLIAQATTFPTQDSFTVQKIIR